MLISQNQTLRLGGRVPVEDLAAAIRMSSSECVQFGGGIGASNAIVLMKLCFAF